MKKLILILALSTTLCKAQTYVPVTIINVTDTVNVNDTIKICFVYGGSSTANMANIRLWTSSYLEDCLNVYAGFLSSYPECDQDTKYIKVKILPEMGFGNARIYSNNTPSNYKPFYIRQNDVSVNELYNNSNITNIKFYDIYGKEKPSQNEGLTIRVTTYSNGYQKKDKVIFQ